jgi:hypothetical protein
MANISVIDNKTIDFKTHDTSSRRLCSNTCSMIIAYLGIINNISKYHEYCATSDLHNSANILLTEMHSHVVCVLDSRPVVPDLNLGSSTQAHILTSMIKAHQVVHPTGINESVQAPAKGKFSKEVYSNSVWLSQLQKLMR